MEYKYTFDLLEAIDNIDYTHLLGYPSEIVALEVIGMVKNVILSGDVNKE